MVSDRGGLMEKGWEETRETAVLPPRSSRCQTPERFFLAFLYHMHTAVQKCEYLRAHHGTVMPAWLVCLAVMHRAAVSNGERGDEEGDDHVCSVFPRAALLAEPAEGFKIA